MRPASRTITPPGSRWRTPRARLGESRERPGRAPRRGRRHRRSSASMSRIAPSVEPSAWSGASSTRHGSRGRDGSSRRRQHVRARRRRRGRARIGAWSLLDRQADVEVHEVLADDLLRRAAPHSSRAPSFHADAQLAVDDATPPRRLARIASRNAFDVVELVAALVELLVHRLELLVRRLELLVRRLELLVRRLQLLVRRLELLVRRLQLLVRRLQLLDRRLQLLARRLRFALRLLQRDLEPPVPRDVGERDARADELAGRRDERRDLDVEVARLVRRAPLESRRRHRVALGVRCRSASAARPAGTRSRDPGRPADVALGQAEERARLEVREREPPVAVDGEWATRRRPRTPRRASARRRRRAIGGAAAGAARAAAASARFGTFAKMRRFRSTARRGSIA